MSVDAMTWPVWLPRVLWLRRGATICCERSAISDRRYEPNGFNRTMPMATGKETAMALANLTDYLDAHNVAYVVISHSPAFTAQGIAGLVHISGKELVKTVIVKLMANW